MATLSTSYQKIATSSAVAFGVASGKIELWAKYNSQSIANNQTNYSIEARLVVTNGYIGEYSGTTLTITGNAINSTKSVGTGNFKTQTLGNASGTATHASTGVGNVNMSVSIYFKTWNKTISVSGSATLPTIPRYATITQFDVIPRDETSLTVNWNTDAVCDSLNYSINGGNWIGAAGNSFIISNLNANSTYEIKIRLKRQDSQLWTESSIKAGTTYDYPHITTTPNFIIGNAVWFGLYNPLSRNCTCTMYGDDWSVIWSTSGWTGTSIGSNNTPGDIENLYKSIPNKKSGNYHIKIQYAGIEKDKVNAGIYTINEEQCIPEFNNFTFEDIDGSVNSLKDNNQILVNRASDCRAIISTSNKAKSKNGASISKYIFSWGDRSSEALETSSEVILNAWDGIGDTLTVTAVDSRGLTKSVSKTITNIAYVNPTIIDVSTERKDGVDVETYLGFNVTLWNGTWNKSEDEDYKNKLKYVGYRVLKDGAWSEYYDISQDALEKISTYEDGNILNVSLNTNSKVAIHENGERGGFPIGQQFTIEIQIKDGNNKATYTSANYTFTKQGIITDGKIGMSRYRDNNGDYHYGFGLMPSGLYTINTEKDIAVNDYAVPVSKFSGIINPQGWFYIGEFYLHTQGEYSVIHCCYGNIQNGAAHQQVLFDINMMKGYDGGDPNNIQNIGIAVNFTQNYISNLGVHIRQNNASTAKLYIYLPAVYSTLDYYITGHSKYWLVNEKMDSEPYNTKEATYYNNTNEWYKACDLSNNAVFNLENIPFYWRELCVVANIRNQVSQLIITRDELHDELYDFRNGYYYNQSVNGAFLCRANNSQLYIIDGFSNGQSVGNELTGTLYCR